jgi:hypothetical protein
MSDRSRVSARRVGSPGARVVPAARPWARAVGTVAAGLALSACGPDPVTWTGYPELRLPPPPASAAAAPDAAADSLVHSLVFGVQREGWETTTTRFRVDSAGALAGAAAGSGRPVPAVDGAPPDPTGTRCPLSLRTVAARAATAAPAGGVDPHAAHAAPDRGPPAHAAAASAATSAAAPASGTDAGGTTGAAAVWWASRPDGSAALYLARTVDGGRTWSAPLAVDTLDRSQAGCDRPAPSIAVDSANGYLHVAYSMQAPEGPGVFYAHQMDPRGPFERPQVIVYGDRPAATSIGSAGDRVVVAYEDPNTGGRPFVSVALSRTAGHSWAERVPVSARNVAAERPVVALRGADEVVLGWVERSAPRQLATTDDARAAVSPLPSGVVVRVGRLRE